MFEWKDSFSCNVSKVNTQHKKLFEIGGRLSDIVSLSDGVDHFDEMIAIMDELVAYTEYHFNYEEELMTKTGYLDLENHKIEHVFFMKKLKRLEKQDFDNNQTESAVKLIEFVADWIAAHIFQTDFQYREHFKNSGIN